MKRKQPTMMNQFMLILFASLSHAYEIDPIPIEINVVDIATQTCTLWEIDVKSNDNRSSTMWRCQMGERGSAMFDIEGMDSVSKPENQIESGVTTLFAEGATIKGHKLVLSPDCKLTFGTAEKTIRKRRNLASATGTKSVLAVRVIAKDVAPTPDAREISDSVFGTYGDPVTMKSQVEGCSHGKLQIEKADGYGSTCLDDSNFNGFYQFPDGSYAGCFWFRYYNKYAPEQRMCEKYGDEEDLAGGSETANTACCVCGGGQQQTFRIDVVEGVLELAVDLKASETSKSVVDREARAALEDLFKTSDMSEIYDHILLCLPPTNESWVGYADIGGIYSVFNDKSCLYPSALVHEFAHNLKLRHSGEGDNVYGDQSGYMGSSYFVDDGPLGAKMCFNPAKSWELGWYADKSVQVYPLSEAWKGHLVGVSNYDESMEDSVILELAGLSTKYFIGFNHASGFNEGTLESINQVTIVTQNGPGEDSHFAARLDAGDSYIIMDYLDSKEDVTIKVTEINTDWTNGFATVLVYAGKEPLSFTRRPTGAPTDLPTSLPTRSPTESPTISPSKLPTPHPTLTPSESPTRVPTQSPTNSPSKLPTPHPTLTPTQSPTISPSKLPTPHPTLTPTERPVLSPLPPTQRIYQRKERPRSALLKESFRAFYQRNRNRGG